ncbi:MAG: helix-turn-helix transcriptional regulator [Janthinobacterium lividum]
MTDFEMVKKELLSDLSVAQEYKNHQTEFDIARTLIQARLEAHMTQAEVAQKMCTSQSHIARMESGDHFPSLQSLQRYVQAVNKKILFEMRPN